MIRGQQQYEMVGLQIHSTASQPGPLEISSFKCSHDAPVYTVVERIVEQSGTPFQGNFALSQR